MTVKNLFNYLLPSSPLGVVAAVLGLPILYVVALSVYNIYFHPLASYAGPKYAVVSRAWWLLHSFRGELSYKTKELHDQYGDVVRIAPNELSYTAPNGWKDIYGHRHGQPENYKDPSENFDGSQSIIFADRVKHSQLRRLLSNAFSEKTLRDQEPVLKSYTDLLIQRLTGRCEGGTCPLDLVKWYNYTTFDIIGHLAFDESFDCLSQSSYHPWVEMIFQLIKYISFIRGMHRIPFVWRFSHRVIPKALVQKSYANKDLTKTKVLRRKTRSPDYIDFMSHLIQAEQKGDLTEQDLISNAQVLVVAGSETTATLLSGATYYILTNPRVMTKLVNEVRSSFTSIEEITISEVNKLSYMLACLNESFRLYPPGANAHPRVSPPDGTMIDGSFVPGNTAMGMNQYAVFRSSQNFTHPESFIPERWLDDEVFKGDRKDALQPFSFGPRNCIGRNLAYVEMRLIMAKLLFTFDLSLAEESRDWINQKIYTVWEKNPLMVRLTPVNSNTA